MAASRQIRLLLWKDYLVRKRNPITLAGVLWATAVVFSLYIVRINVDNQDFPTCQFPARALPSAGVMTFLQSFICSVNNECSPMDEFEEIPLYKNAKLTKLKNQLLPLFSNSSLLETAGSVPHALRLLATLSDVADVPDFVYIAKNGLHVKELFRNSDRVKRYLAKELNMAETVANSFLDSELSFEGLLQGNLDRCKPESIIKTFKIANTNDLNKLVEKICPLSSSDVQKLLIDVLLELDLGKYMQMLGNMYYKLSKDDRLTGLGKMIGAALHMVSIQSFLPPEMTEILYGETPEFSYVQLDVISNLLDYFEPNFGDTQSYKSFKDYANIGSVVVQYLNRFLEKQRKQSQNEITSPSNDDSNKLNLRSTLKGVSNVFSNAIEAFDDFADDKSSVDAFDVMSQILNFIFKWLPDNTKHDVLFYSTLITKLIEGAERVIYINVHLEKLVYNVSLRHPRGIETLISLPLDIFEKSLDALADPERAQLLTSKLDVPGEMFCDHIKLQKFFEINNDEAVKLRERLCTAAWKEYVTDMIRSFGIYEVRNNINTMASLFIQESLGKDTASQLYTLDRDFATLKNFSRFVNAIEEAEPDAVNWNNVFDVNANSDIMTMVRNKKHAANEMLVTVHGVLAKAVVKQNPILEFKISPFFIEATAVIDALNKEVEETPLAIAEEAKKLYPAMLRTVLTTTLDEDKTYKLLSTFSQDALCAGAVNASKYLNFPSDVDNVAVTNVLCNLTTLFEKILTHDSHLGKAVANITSEDQQTKGIPWTKLITDLKNLYAKMTQYYPYLLEYKTYGMDERTRKQVAVMIRKVKSFWFSPNNWSRGARMSIKLAFELLDLVDREIFDIKSDAWLQIKYNFDLMTGPLFVIDDVIKMIEAITKNETFTSPLPTDTQLSLSRVIPNLAQLLQDAADLIIKDDTQIEPIIEIMNANKPWPCSATSLADLLMLSNSSKDAVRALESLLCMPRAEQEEWNEYLESNNIYKHKLDDGNITRVGTHLFLRFSRAFDKFIEDISLINDILLDALDESPDRVTVATAWRHAVHVFNTTERDHILRNLFAKVDAVVNSIRMPVNGGVPLITLWRNFMNCNSGPVLEEGCRDVGRATWLNIIKFLSVAMSNVAEDLLTYVQEIHEPDSNMLQLMGFTKKTGLYLLYDKLPDFIGVLVNSYGDYGFMTQIRRAAHSSFWDCEAVVNSLAPAPGSPIDEAIIARVRPLVCPSFLHWISLPRGDNAILDVIAKPQYYFFTSLVDNLNSTFENAFMKGTSLSNFITDLSNNKSKVQENYNLDTVRDKLTRAVDIMLNYKINATNPSYRMFNEANNKLAISTAYLTRIVTIINKVLNNMENLNDTITDVPENEAKKVEEDVSAFKRIFKRRPTEGIAVFFDAVTNNLWENEDHSLVKTFQASCSRFKNNDTSKVILTENNRVKVQICAMNYDFMMSLFGTDLESDMNNARLSLIHFVNMLTNNDENIVDISEFLKERKDVISYLKSSIKYAYDLGVPVFLKYLHNNIQNYDVIMVFLSGGDWWQKIRELYNGPYATNFFESIEKIFEIAEDFFNNLDQVHWVRLMRDINANSKEGFCALNTPLTEYIPDATGVLSHLKEQICSENVTEVFKELTPLRFASQIYDSNLKISNDVDYTGLNWDVTRIELHLDNVLNGPTPPQVPKWVTKEKLKRFRESAIALLSTESLIKVLFGFLSNTVDAGTLLLNNSQCTLCSQFTTWFKQLNLQLYKKQEYDNLLCHLHEMDLHDVYHTLKHDFHWDMAIKELISTRNYTKFELNKSINEFLGQTKQHLLEDITAPTTKISKCLTQNVTRNAYGNATLFAKVLAYTLKLIRAELPHLQEIDGIREVKYLKDLQTEVAHRLDAEVPLKKYMRKGYNLSKSLKEFISKDYLVKAVENSRLNVHIAHELRPEDLLFDDEHTWEDLCECCDCNAIVDNVFKNLNTSLIDIDLQQVQEEEFWRFNFISNILKRVEDLVGHVARLLGVVSKVDVEAVTQGRLVSVIDTTMQLLMDDILSSIVYSVRGLMTELTPLIKSRELETSLFDISEGLLVLQDIKNSLLENDIKVAVSELFSDPDRLEMDLSRLGINNTNFWSIAAPRIQVGYIHFKPIFVSKRDNFRISDFVCEMEDMAKVIVPENLDVVTSEDVHGAVIEQFCDLEEARAKEVVFVLLRNLNSTFIINKVKDWLLNGLYTASELTAAEGEQVLESFPQMAALVPVLQNNIANLNGLLDDEPLLEYFKNDFSINNILGGGGDFMADAGRMMCGKPFNTHVNRYFKTIVEAKDKARDADSEQLKVLPTEFCRTMYKEIVNADGGKIVWSFVKPLVMGKILYTPATAAVERIIKRANETFAPMVKTINLVHAFAKAFSSVDTLTEHRDGLTALTDLLTAPSMATLRISLLGNSEMPDFNIDDVFEKLTDTKGLGSILQKGSDILDCINLNRFKPVTDEQHLSEEAARLMRVNEFSAGLVFLSNGTSAELPLNVSYKIRMDIENTPTTNRLKNYFWVPGPESNFLDNMRYFRGFIQIQDIVDKAIIDVSANTNSKEGREEDDNDPKWAMYTQQMPYPCYRKDFFQTSLYESQSLIVAFFFSLLFTTSSVVRFIVSDKETGNTVLMAVMGVDLSYHTLSWYLSSLVELLLTCTCVATVLCFGGVLPHTAPTMIFMLLYIYAFSVLCFCYMLSKLFKAASFAAVCSGLAYMVSFMPFVLILSWEALLTSSLKFLVCISMSSSLCYAFLYILRYEATGLGAQWTHLWNSPVEADNMSIGVAASIIVLDGIIYILIGLLLERFYGFKALQKNVISSKSSGEKAGVSVINVSKVYGSGTQAKLALDNVSVELHTGQITTLLGHNGAGKTTLIKIMTGMLKPTQGHVVMRGESGGGAGIGVCPQRDVLVRELTAREHVQLYAQLKSGRDLSELREQVESILRVLSLGAVAEEPVSSLSGGTRRRLCVALAFVAEPGLVVLDEPTAGVDPAARRDIWSMILKLRENRTILLSTHHLDEAELLSDQIVIMHKGQVHTTGSPIEIKRSLGSGYKLTVMYPERSRKLVGLEDTVEDEEIGLEEKTKILLATVRSVIKNANLMDVNGLEVEITLPYFDTDGISNNYLELCKLLETSQSELGFRNFSMDCCSLEQVFFNICQQADASQQTIELETPSKSASTSSLKNDRAPLVPREGPLVASAWNQFLALLYARYLHYSRNRSLLFMLLVLPLLFVIIAMAFSKIRPPPNNEFALKLHRALYVNTTEFLVKNPSKQDPKDNAAFAREVMDLLAYDQNARNWTLKDNPECNCLEIKQECYFSDVNSTTLPDMMLFPDVKTLNDWLIASQEIYIEKRYGGYSSTINNDISNMVVWYNNKGHHAMPSYLNAMNNAVLRARTGRHSATITTYTHPLKISKEPVNKDTVYQHVADAGITAMILIAYSLVSAGGSVYLVTARCSQEKRLQLLAGVKPALYWTTALVWDMAIILINLLITTIVLQTFHFPVFVTRNNLPAICVLIVLYGYGCAGVVHVTEKLFSQPSLANMVLFCANTFVGIVGLAVLLILDIISESEITDNARWILHKIFMLSPQFVLGDGVLEIAKNTIQAQVLGLFGMDTYRDPLLGDLIVYHYVALALIGTVLFLLNLAIEYDCFEVIFDKFRSEKIEPLTGGDQEVLNESRRVLASRAPLRLKTIGNINAGFVDTEDKCGSMKSSTPDFGDVAQCLRLGKAYPALGGRRIAVRDFTLGIPPGQCTALLGQNGAGKSTTFAMLTGQVRPTTGCIYLDDRRVGPRDLCQGLISYCPQSDAIDPLMTVWETLKFYCKLRGITDEEEVIKRTMEIFDLTKYRDVRSGKLSGGNKRKLCTAIAFMGRTPLVLLDEPTSGMDPGSRACVSRGVRRACTSGRGVLLTTHALDDARRLAARVALLQDGTLRALAPLDDCLRRFGGGHAVWWRVRSGAVRGAWRRLRAAAPQAQLQALHQNALHFLLPARCQVDGKEVTTKLSDVFRLTAEMQSCCDIEDYTVNQSSLDQMFLSFAGSSKSRGTELEEVDLSPLATPAASPLRSRRCSSEEMGAVTAL